VNGFIEIYVDGWLRYRWLFTLRDYESFSWEEQIDLRAADLVKIIAHLKEIVIPNFDPSRTEIQIAYESKMNQYVESEMPGASSDGIYNAELFDHNVQVDGRIPTGGTP